MLLILHCISVDVICHVVVASEMIKVILVKIDIHTTNAILILVPSVINV